MFIPARPAAAVAALLLLTAGSPAGAQIRAPAGARPVHAPAPADVAALAGTHCDPPWAPIVLVATPAAQLAVSVAIERRGR